MCVYDCPTNLNQSYSVHYASYAHFSSWFERGELTFICLCINDFSITLESYVLTHLISNAVVDFNKTLF